MSRRTLPMTAITEILYQWTKGVSKRQIVKQTGISRNTVKKIINQGIEFGLVVGFIDDDKLLSIGADVTYSLKNKGKSEGTSSGSAQQPLIVNHEQLKLWLAEPYMTIRQVLRLLSDLEPPVTISETSLHRYIKRHFPKEKESTVVLHTLPAEQAQVDFGYAGMTYDPALKKTRRTHAFVMTLSYSRLRFVIFVYKQDIETWIHCHVEAFKFFNGVPQTVLLDNLKSGVIKADIYDPTLNISYAECARYYGFVIDPSKVRTPTHKGKVERSIQIIRQQLLAGRTYDSIHKLNEYTLNWCRNIISNEVTRTTGEAPMVRFKRDEQEKLIKLPAVPYEYAIWQTLKVARDQHITFKGSFYSLPIKYVGKTVLLKATQKMIYIHELGKQVKVHPRAHIKGQWQTDINDYSKDARYYLDNTPEICIQRAAKIGSATMSVLRSLLEKPSTSKLRKAQAILRLAQKHSDKRLESACAHALQFGETTFKALQRIIIHKFDESTSLELSTNIDNDNLSKGAFLRDPNEFLIQ